MQLYRHRQTGTVILAAVGLAAVAIGAALFIEAEAGIGVAITPAVVLIVLILSLLLFGTLTVEVSTERITLWFGPGLIRRNFPVRDVRRATAVRNPWYYGWGIRLTPIGWLFNVSGLDAVEIELGSGKKFRIGTDRPQELLSAIQGAISGRYHADT